jgi:threonine/homoserine/homoserine lactone efflux protein
MSSYFSITPGSATALFAAMVVLAAVPSTSVLAVVSRAAGAGFVHGAATALGIVAGDIVLILIAFCGLAFAEEVFGGGFTLLRYLGGLYLIVLGLSLWRSDPSGASGTVTQPGSLGGGFLAGLLITLGDQKAILFYLGFLPGFVDLERATPFDIGLVVGITIVSVGGVKLTYAALAGRTRDFIGGGASRWLNRVAGFVMVLVGVCLWFEH